MDFDHVRGEKVAAVSVLVSKGGASEEIIRDELAKSLRSDAILMPLCAPGRI
ncbi:MAG: hypothetical protein WD250_00955 [Egibacteraceae bacterium]